MQKWNRGFSLIEILVASFIFIIVLGIILNIYISGSDIYENTKYQADLQAQARLALNSMASELANATRTTPPVGQSPPNLWIPSAPNNNNITFYLPAYVLNEVTQKLQVSINANGVIQWDNTPLSYQFVSGQGTLTRTAGGIQTILARDVTSVQFINSAIDTSLYANEIRIILTLTKTTPRQRSITITLSSLVRLRN